MNISISTIVSIIIFILGFFIREVILRYSKNKKIKDSENYLNWLLNNTIEALPIQIKGYRDLAIDIKTHEFRNWFIEPKLTPKSILDKEELFHKIIFERKVGDMDIKTNTFNSIIENIKMINLILDHTDLMFKEENNKILKYESDLNQLGSLLRKKIIDLEINKPNEKEIIEFYNNYLESDQKTEVRDDIASLCDRIENFIIREKKSELLDFLEVTSSYRKSYTYYKATLSYFYQKIIEYKSNLIQANSTLKYNFNNYNKMKFKRNLL